MAINESLGLEDGGIADQLKAIKNKNQELLDLNEDLLVSQKETQEIARQLDIHCQDAFPISWKYLTKQKDDV